MGRELRQCGDIVLEVFGIAVKLGFEDFEGSQRVRLCRVGILQRLVAVELVGSLECAALHLVEDRLHVDEVAVIEVHSDTSTEEFLDEHRYVKAVGVEARDITALQPSIEATCYLREGGAVSDIGIRDAMHGRGLCGDGHLGIDASGLGLALAVGADLQDRDLDDAVTSDLYARRLQVEEDDRAL